MNDGKENAGLQELPTLHYGERLPLLQEHEPHWELEGDGNNFRHE